MEHAIPVVEQGGIDGMKERDEQQINPSEEKISDWNRCMKAVRAERKSREGDKYRFLLQLLQSHGDRAVNSCYVSPLSMKLQMWNVAEFLLKHGADACLRDGNGQTLLHIAVRYGKAAMVELLIEKGGDIDACQVYTESYQNDFPLMKVWMRETGATAGYAPLHMAAKYGQVDVVELLIEKGADIHARGAQGVPTWMWWKIEQKDLHPSFEFKGWTRDWDGNFYSLIH